MRCLARAKASPAGTPLPVDQLLGQALGLYRSAFAPLLGAAALGAVLSIALDVAFSPTSFVAFYLWLSVTLVPLAVAQAAILIIVIEKRKGAAPNIVSGYTLALTFSPAYLGAWVIYFGSLMLALVTVILIPLAGFLVARWALYGPAVVVERSPSALALIRSWRLTKGRAWRTFGIQILMIAISFIANLVSIGIAAALGGGTGLAIVAGGLMLTLVQPLWTITNLLLFEDYRRLTDEAQADANTGQDALPPVGPPPMEPKDDLRRT